MLVYIKAVEVAGFRIRVLWSGSYSRVRLLNFSLVSQYLRIKKIMTENFGQHVLKLSSMLIEEFRILIRIRILVMGG